MGIKKNRGYCKYRSLQEWKIKNFRILRTLDKNKPRHLKSNMKDARRNSRAYSIAIDRYDNKFCKKEIVYGIVDNDSNGNLRTNVFDYLKEHGLIITLNALFGSVEEAQKRLECMKKIYPDRNYRIRYKLNNTEEWKDLVV